MCDKRFASPYFGKTILWQNDILAKWFCGRTTLWQNDILVKWYFGKAILWQNDILGYTLAAFQTNTLFKAKDFADWFTKWPQIEWQKNRQSKGLWSSAEKQQQEHYEANGPPRSPNYVLLSLVLIYWYNCAVLFAAPRVVQECARLGYVLSSWVPGRRDAAVHEHALKSCAAHTGFLCKDRSAKLEFEIVLVMKTMSVALSIGLCCVISVIVRKCCGLRLAVPSANKPTPSEYSNRSANIQH